jgi:lysine 2,3-aminomutase
VVDPDRIRDALLRSLETDRALYVVVHANHPREFSPAATKACARLTAAGIPLLSQSVLLRGVNDDPATLERLMRAFVERRIKPYYLHHGDLAKGTSHFRVALARGRALVDGLRGRVSGLCQPTYVLDLPGGHGKVPVSRSYVERVEGDRWHLRDMRGAVHVVRDTGA